MTEDKRIVTTKGLFRHSGAAQKGLPTGRGVDGLQQGSTAASSFICQSKISSPRATQSYVASSSSDSSLPRPRPRAPLLSSPPLALFAFSSCRLPPLSFALPSLAIFADINSCRSLTCCQRPSLFSSLGCWLPCSRILLSLVPQPLARRAISIRTLARSLSKSLSPLAALQDRPPAAQPMSAVLAPHPAALRLSWTSPWPKWSANLAISPPTISPPSRSTGAKNTGRAPRSKYLSGPGQLAVYSDMSCTAFPTPSSPPGSSWPNKMQRSVAESYLA